jgi:hypothetical protein
MVITFIAEAVGLGAIKPPRAHTPLHIRIACFADGCTLCRLGDLVNIPIDFVRRSVVKRLMRTSPAKEVKPISQTGPRLLPVLKARRYKY